VAILEQFKAAYPLPLYRGDIVADIGTESISFYLSSLKYHGLINNPTRGFWTLTEKGIKA
jgi:predicted transcriptional regulator